MECGGDLPYCRNETFGDATCSATKSSSCPPPPSTFVCLAEGVFPNPLDCQSYINCVAYNGDNFFTDVYACDDLYAFDPNAPLGYHCRLIHSVTDHICVTVDCKNTPAKNIVMSYPDFPASKGEIVATCRGDKMPLVTRCPAGFRANLTPIPAQCNIACTEKGIFEYPGDVTRFYECILTDSGFTAKAKDCFRGYVYNKVTKNCDITYARQF